MQTTKKRSWLSPTGGLLLILISGCVLTPDHEAVPKAAVPVADDADPEGQPEPVLAIPDAYETISLSVQAGDPVAAIDAYQEAELEDPDDPATRVLLANLYLMAGDTSGAATIIEEVLESDPGQTDGLYLLSLIRGAEGDAAAQRALLDQILEINPSHARARASLGEILLKHREFTAAAATFEQAIRDEPDNLVARIGLGNVYLRQRRFEDAEKQLDAAIEIAPDNSFAYSDRARARALQHRLDSADADLTVALELEPDHYWHYIDRGRVRLEDRRFEAAAADFAVAVSLNDDLFLGYALRAQANDALDNIEAAFEDYRTALRMRPDYAPAFIAFGVLSYMNGELAGAADYFHRAFQREPRRFDLALLHALMLKSDGRERDATAFLNSIVSTVPRDTLDFEMIRYYLQPANEGLIMNRLREATDRTLRARMYFYLGAQLELLGRTRTAQASLMEAETNLPPGFLEQRLAAWRMQAYRSQEE